MSYLKEKIKNFIVKFKIKLKYKNSTLIIGKNNFISRKAKVIMEDNSELIIGDNCYISDNVRIIVHKNSKLIIENNVYISINSIVTSNSEIVIGKDTSIAHNVTIIDTNKNYQDKNTLIRKQGVKVKPINIGSDCWIATGVVILPGVSLGKHCVVGANSVVNKCFEAGSIVAGVPAKVVRVLE